MSFIVLAYLGGVLTIVSPCILPVVPLVFARADQPFARSGLPLLAGMALTFAGVATLAVAGGAWVTQASEFGRWFALAVCAVFGLALLLPAFSARVMRPLVDAGSVLERFAGNDRADRRIVTSILLGVATGLLWAPCAGPILGLVLTWAVLHKGGAGTPVLLVAYAAGAATSLAVALLAGGRALAAMKRSLGMTERFRQGIGAVILIAVGALATGLDTRALTLLPAVTTSGIEQRLVDRLSPTAGSGESGAKAANAANAANATEPAVTSSPLSKPSDVSRDQQMDSVVRVSMPAPLPVEGTLPSLSGAVQWLNSPPLDTQALRGKVVVVDFWTYSCINCLRTLPYLKAWSKRYRDQGLVVIGVHAPEFGFEHNVDNVKRAAADLGVDYPVAIDNDYAIWQAFGNRYWPAFYVVDGEGRVRYHQFGEGGYARTEEVIRQLLSEAGHARLPAQTGSLQASGSQVAPDPGDQQSGETYVGYEQAQGFASPEAVLPGSARNYTAPAEIELNAWGLEGRWAIGPEQAQLADAPGKIVFRFHARDLNLVMGPAPGGKPVRFRVTVDGAPPGASHGSDVAADGSGTVDAERLYQLVRQAGPVKDRTFSIEFLDPGATAYSFTFG